MESDPVMQALGLEPVTATSQESMLSAQQLHATWYQQQAAWEAAMWHMQQAAMYQPCPQPIVQIDGEIVSTPRLGCTTEGVKQLSPPQSTPQKPALKEDASEDASTAPGSPETGDSEEDKADEDAEAARSLHRWLAREIEGKISVGPPAKLELDSLIFGKPKDPVSAHLLQLLKSGPSKSQEEESSDNAGIENFQRASGAHRKAAVAVAAVTTAEVGTESETKPRRKSRGGQGRANRNSRK